MKLKLRQIYQIGFTILSIVVTIIIPLVNYFNFKNSIRSLARQINLGDLESIYGTLIYVFVFIGIIISVCTYFVHNFQKYSVQRGICVLFISTVYMVNSIFSSQMSTIFIGVANVQIIMNSSGVYILFIIIAIFFVIKAVFDVIDFKVNQSYYTNELRRRRGSKYKQEKLGQKIAPCPKCSYACRINWKKCPICKTKIIVKMR